MSIFHALKPKEVQVLNEIPGCMLFKKDQTIFQEGAVPNALYIISDGKVKLSKLSYNGKEQITRLAKTGQILGYRSLLSGETYQATATALEDTRLCYIPREVFLRFLKENHEFSLQLVELLSKELGEAEDKMAHLAQDSVRERLAQAFIILADTYGYQSDGKTLNVKLSREEIANLVGTATETVIRLITDFRKEKLIDSVRKEIQILDAEKLSKIGHMDM